MTTQQSTQRTRARLTPAKAAPVSQRRPVPAASRGPSAAFETLESRQLFSGYGGALDTTFGDSGKVITDVTGAADAASSVAVQPNGKTVVAGVSDGWLTVVRYNVNGTLDTGFSGDGLATTLIGDQVISPDVAVHDGKVIVAASVYISGFSDTAIGVARFNSNGSLDNSFDGDGKMIIDGFTVSTPTGTKTASEHLGGVAVRGDGRIYLAGSASVSNGYNQGNDVHFALARLNTNGSLDNAFAGDGRFTHEFSAGQPTAQDSGHAVLVQGSRVYIGGESDGKFGLVKISDAGTVDWATTVDMSDKDNRITALGLDNDGKVLAGGRAEDPGGNVDWGIARFNHANGSLDNGFSTDGKLVINMGGWNETLVGIAADANNKVVAGGTSFYDAKHRMTVARFTSDGVATPGFYGSSIARRLSYGTGDTKGEDLAVAPSGRIMVTGTSVHGGQQRFTTVRMNGFSAKPAAPANFAAVPVTKTQLYLSWDDVAMFEDGYLLQRSTNAAFTGAITAVNLGANTTSYQATGLSANTTYYFRLCAENGFNESAWQFAQAKTLA